MKTTKSLLLAGIAAPLAAIIATTVPSLAAPPQSGHILMAQATPPAAKEDDEDKDKNRRKPAATKEDDSKKPAARGEEKRDDQRNSASGNSNDNNRGRNERGQANQGGQGGGTPASAGTPERREAPQRADDNNNRRPDNRAQGNERREDNTSNRREDNNNRRADDDDDDKKPNERGNANRGNTAPPATGNAERNATPPATNNADQNKTPPQRAEDNNRRNGTPPTGNAERNTTPPATGNADQNRTPPQRAEDNNRRGPDNNRASDDRRGPDNNNRAEDNRRDDNNRRADDNNRRDGDNRRDQANQGNPGARPTVVVREEERVLPKRREGERVEGGQVLSVEPGRVVIRTDKNELTIRSDDNERFRRYSRDVEVERMRGGFTRTVVVARDGGRIITIRDDNGNIAARWREEPNRQRVYFIGTPDFFDQRGDFREDRWRERRRDFDRADYFDFERRLPPVRVNIPRDRYIVEYRQANPQIVYETFAAAPVENVERAYTLEEVRRSERLREKVRRIDLDTITFETGSAEITQDQARSLEAIAQAINNIIKSNPSQVFLIEGHTDAVGSDVDNLELSDRRAQAVAEALTQFYQIPPENLVTQGYGEEQLKVQTDGPERANRRVTMSNISGLLHSDNKPVAN